MIIKKKKSKKKNNFTFFTKFLYLYFLISITFGTILIIAIFQSQLFINKRNIILDHFSKAGRYEYLYLPQIVFKAIKSNFYKLEKLDLEIPFEKTLILENLRNESILNDRLPPADKMPKIKTKIFFNEKEFGADIRLKGDRIIHFIEKDKSSYKLELDRNQYIFGIKKFSIQKPRVRNYVHEWIFHELSKNEGIIKIKYDFINLSINGDDKGLYVIEEGFGKELIERNKRRNGPIFGLDEDINKNYDNPVFEIYNKKYWFNPKNNLVTNIASQKLLDFFDNKAKIEEVFDLEKWAAYFAIIDLTANYHGAFLKSVKFYYNPINGLFEPIPFDGHRKTPNYHKFNMNYDNRILIDIVQNPIGRSETHKFTWLKNFFYKDGKLNQKFYNLYSSYLNKISSKKYIDNFLSKNLDKIEEINSHIYADYFFYDNSVNYGIGLYYFLVSDFKHHAQNIRNKLKTNNSVQLLKINENEYLFKPFYKNYNQIAINNFLCTNDGKEVELELSKDLNNFESTRIYLYNMNTKGFTCNSAILFDKLNKKNFSLKIDHLNSELLYKNFKKKYSKTFQDFFDEKDGQLRLKKDSVEINTSIFIPNGYNIVIEPGQKLFLTNKAFIISNSHWNIGGTGKPVSISGKKGNLGGGILIGDTKEVSKIENTEFSYLSGYDFEKNFEYIILGSVNFHQTKVKIQNVNFKNIFSEDAINIFRSNFDIIDVGYSNISSDAIDIDFSYGNINKAKFVDIKNDAIDFSGSNVTINNTYFNNVKDKIISAGENSIININLVKGINSYAGIISKDGSKVFSKNIYFDGVKIPFAAYQKKNEYENPLLEIKDYEIKDFLIKSIQDTTADLISEDENVVMKSKKIISIMYDKNISSIQ
jgi:hypothetical protein